MRFSSAFFNKIAEETDPIEALILAENEFWDAIDSNIYQKDIDEIEVDLDSIDMSYETEQYVQNQLDNFDAEEHLANLRPSEVEELWGNFVAEHYSEYPEYRNLVYSKAVEDDEYLKYFLDLFLKQVKDPETISVLGDLGYNYNEIYSRLLDQTERHDRAIEAIIEDSNVMNELAYNSDFEKETLKNYKPDPPKHLVPSNKEEASELEKGFFEYAKDKIDYDVISEQIAENEREYIEEQAIESAQYSAQDEIRSYAKDIKKFKAATSEKRCSLETIFEIDEMFDRNGTHLSQTKRWKDKIEPIVDDLRKLVRKIPNFNQEEYELIRSIIQETGVDMSSEEYQRLKANPEALAEFKRNIELRKEQEKSHDEALETDKEFNLNRQKQKVEKSYEPIAEFNQQTMLNLVNKVKQKGNISKQELAGFFQKYKV